MAKTIEVFADITCPFTHVGLARVAELLERTGAPYELRVRAWPLEWVNGTPMKAAAVAATSEALRRELGTTLFAGDFSANWPTSTIPALNLTASAYSASPETGLAVSLKIRQALFEQGLDISATEVLSEIAGKHGLATPGSEPTPDVLGDYDAGKARGVKGSPDFFVDDHEFFCPALELGHDDSGELTASFDMAGLNEFMEKVLAD